MLTLELPYPPSINHYWRNVKGRVLISREGRQYRNRILIAVIGYKNIFPMMGPLAMSIKIHPPDKRRRDIDNVLKALLDSLEHAGVYENDSQIEYLEIKKLDSLKGGNCFVKIGKYNGT